MSTANALRCSQSPSLWLTVTTLLLATASLSAQQPWPQTSPNPYPGGDGPGSQNYPQYSQPAQAADAYADPFADDQQPSPSPNAAPAQALRNPQIEQLVAPIALYPDLLIAQILTAATYPAQVIDADRWLQSQGNIAPEQVVAGADAQTWDPSVKALTAFPQVLAQMDQNVRWTIALGNAYYNQPQDVLNVVQEMRQRAQAAGNLQSTPQESVSDEQGYVQIAPTNPQVVYLPTYNPWDVYGDPVRPYPGFSLVGALGSFFGSSPVQYGLQFALSAFTHSNWGFFQWGLNWLSQAVLFHQSPFYSHSRTVADWGLPHGGPRASGWRGREGRYDHDFYRADNNRGSRPGNGFYGSRDNGYRGGLPQPSRPGESFVGRPYENPQRALQRTPQSTYRESNGREFAYTRPPSFDRMPSPGARPQQPLRPPMNQGYLGNRGTSGQSGSYGGSYGGRFASPVPQQPYRPPMNGYQHNQFAERGFANNRGSFEGGQYKPEKSGGFHLFGGGNHAPKAYKAPKESRGGGGGHFSGGHGGGHSSGGHSGGGHSGGGHHR